MSIASKQFIGEPPVTPIKAGDLVICNGTYFRAVAYCHVAADVLSASWRLRSLDSDLIYERDASNVTRVPKGNGVILIQID